MQACLSTVFPRRLQSLPPDVGGGLEHERDREWVPPAQLFVHVVQAVHSERPPLTANKEKRLCNIMRNLKQLNVSAYNLLYRKKRTIWNQLSDL